MPERILISKRYGANLVPISAALFILIAIYFIPVFRFKYNYFYNPGPGFIVLAIILLLPTSYFLFYVFNYQIFVEDSIIYAPPLVNNGPLMKMFLSDIETVDLKALSGVGLNRNGRSSPSVIVLYRKGWDGQELFALDPSRTNLKQFKELVRLIYDRCPGTFTEAALRYLNSPKLKTPGENRQGELIW